MNNMEVPLSNSQQDIITAINKLETIGYVTEFDKILNNLAIERKHPTIPSITYLENAR